MKPLILLVTVIGLGALVGCASVEGFLQKNTLAAQLIVQEATARAIEAGPKADQPARAAKIASTASAIKVTFDTTATTLPGLVQLATQRILALKLGPADAVIAQALLDALAAQIQAKVCPANSADPNAVCTLSADKTVYVDTVLDWISSTAALYAPKA